MTNKYRRILVLGSNSFTGSNYINETLSKNNKIVGVSRSIEPPRFMLPYKENKHVNNFTFIRLDLNNKMTKLFSLIDNFKPDLVINFAAQGEVRNSWIYPDQWYQTNCNLIINLTKKLINNKYLKRYVSISTPEVYGSNLKKIKESNNFNPSTPYAASKLAGDLHLITLHKKYNFPVVFTRSANVYGPSQQLYRIIPKTFISLKNEEKLQLHGRGVSMRSFIYVSDVCEAINKVINHGKKGDVYHISNNKLYSIKEIVSKICSKMKKSFKNNIELVDENYGQDNTYRLNSNKIRNELKWSDKVNLDDGIDKTFFWIEKNWKNISNMPHKYIHKI